MQSACTSMQWLHWLKHSSSHPGVEWQYWQRNTTGNNNAIESLYNRGATWPKITENSHTGHDMIYFHSNNAPGATHCGRYVCVKNCVPNTRHYKCSRWSLFTVWIASVMECFLLSKICALSWLQVSKVYWYVGGLSTGPWR